MALDPETKENLLLLAAFGIGGFMTKMFELGWNRLWFVRDRHEQSNAANHKELEVEVANLRTQIARANAREKQLATALQLIVEVMKEEFGNRNANLIERVNKILRDEAID